MVKVPCPRCLGVKTIDVKIACLECKGYGLVQDKDEQFVPCPAECDHGTVTCTIGCPTCKGLGYVTG